MKQASKVMYIIGTVFGVLGLILGIIFALSGAISASAIQSGTIDAAQYNNITLEEAQLVMIWGIVLCVLYFLDILIGTFGRRAVGKRKGGNAPHIIALVVGIFGNIFFLLGGIFGLVASDEK